MNRLFSKTHSMIQYYSDLHIERGFRRIIQPKKQFLLLCGDIGHPSKFQYEEFLLNVSGDFDKVFVLAGNHEYDLTDISKTEIKINEICEKRNNLYFLQKNTHILCKEENIILAGCTLWSSRPKTKYEYHIEHVKWLKSTIEDKNNNYVIATHHLPLFKLLNEVSKVPNYFASDQIEIIKNPNIVCWFYGHSHLNKNRFFYNKWFLTNQYGNYEKPEKGFIL